MMINDIPKVFNSGLTNTRSKLLSSSLRRYMQRHRRKIPNLHNCPVRILEPSSRINMYDTDRWLLLLRRHPRNADGANTASACYPNSRCNGPSAAAAGYGGELQKILQSRCRRRMLPDCAERRHFCRGLQSLYDSWHLYDSLINLADLCYRESGSR